jgi:hypothetical protein
MKKISLCFAFRLKHIGILVVAAIYSVGFNPLLAKTRAPFDGKCNSCHINSGSNSTSETVYFTVQANTSTSACGQIPIGISNPVVLGDFSSINTQYGSFIVNNSTACITYHANSTPGFNVDTIFIYICGSGTQNCHIISYIPTILPASYCTPILEIDSLHTYTTNCSAGADVCIDIRYHEILNYTLFDNGLPFSGNISGCNADTVVAYNLLNLLNGGVFGAPSLVKWEINSVTYSGSVSTPNELKNLLNLIDPLPGWTVNANLMAIGGSPQNNYGNIEITSFSGTVIILNPSMQLSPNGTNLHLTAGKHKIIFKHTNTGCLDTLKITVDCLLKLNEGWNLISSFIQPNAPNMRDVFAPIEGDILLVKDANGKVYVPSQGYLNTIGNWEVGKGYQIKAKVATVLTMNGATVMPQNTPIPIKSGWQIIPYLRTSEGNAPEMLNSINGNVVLLKNNAGQIYTANPFLINTIGKLLPGQGYWLKSNGNGTLVYPSN